MMHWDHSVHGYTQQHATAAGVSAAVTQLGPINAAQQSHS